MTIKAEYHKSENYTPRPHEYVQKVAIWKCFSSAVTEKTDWKKDRAKLMLILMENLLEAAKDK